MDVLYVIDAGKTGFPAFGVATLAGVPCVVEIGDPQARLYASQGRSTWSVAAGYAIDRVVACMSDGVAVRGRALAEESGMHGPWMFLPDGVDLDRFWPGADSGLRSRLGIADDRLVAGVVGSISWSATRETCYGMEIVEALGQLPDCPTDAMVVGDGTGLEHLRRRAVELGVSDRVHVVGRVAHTQVPEYICAMDVCVSTQSNDSVGRGRTTAKLPEYLACDRFVIATRVGEAARILPGEMLLPYHDSFDSGFPTRLATRLNELLPDLAELRGGAGTRDIARELYDYAKLSHRWELFLDRVVHG